jgi:ribosomal protein S12 methylthiotransferase accessory factor
MGELAELASACSWGDETTVTAAFADLGTSAVSPAALVGLSDAQYSERERWNEEYGWHDWRPPGADPREPIDWMEAEDASSGRRKLVPADAVLIGRREPGDGSAVAIADSNGCASGETLDAAKRRAILELIERDAVGLWWYGAGSSSARAMAELCESRTLIDYIQNRKRHTRLLEITRDLPGHVFAAVTFEHDGRHLAIGSAASFEPGEAAQSAIVEALQMELSLEIARGNPDCSPAWRKWLSDVDISTPPLSAIDEASAAPYRPSGPTPLSKCLDVMAKVGISIYCVDLTRPELGIPTVRALSSDLCHFKPRFARTRFGRLVSPLPASDRIPFLV